MIFHFTAFRVGLMKDEISVSHAELHAFHTLNNKNTLQSTFKTHVFIKIFTNFLLILCSFWPCWWVVAEISTHLFSTHLYLPWSPSLTFSELLPYTVPSVRDRRQNGRWWRWWRRGRCLRVKLNRGFRFLLLKCWNSLCEPSEPNYKCLNSVSQNEDDTVEKHDDGDLRGVESLGSQRAPSSQAATRQQEH